MHSDTTISTLDQHPNSARITNVLARIGDVTDAHLRALAWEWISGPAPSETRSRALQPENPLIVEVLTVFTVLDEIFSADMSGGVPYVEVDPELAQLGVNAIRDAIAGEYAHPLLGRGEYRALTRPWRAVMSRVSGEPNQNRQFLLVSTLLDRVRELGTRCHEDELEQRYTLLALRALQCDESEVDGARTIAFAASVRSGRRRTWGLVRNAAMVAASLQCGECAPTLRREYAESGDTERVSTLVADAACGLLVADLVSPGVRARLLHPLSTLITLPE